MPTEEEIMKAAETLNAMAVPKRSEGEIQMLAKINRRKPQGPAHDWFLAAEGAERAIRSITAAIEGEGYEVLMDATDASYSVRPREDYYVDDAEYAAASPAVQKAMRHFWRRSGEFDADKIKTLERKVERLTARIIAFVDMFSARHDLMARVGPAEQLVIDRAIAAITTPVSETHDDGE